MAFRCPAASGKVISHDVKHRLLPSDKLGRDVVSKRIIKDIVNGRIPSAIFIDRSSPLEISVNRLTPEQNQQPPADRPDLVADSVIAKRGDLRVARLKKMGKLSPKNQFYGCAVLSVEDAEQRDRSVHIDPTPENEQHAYIQLPAEAERNISIREEHAEDLALCVVWRPRPK